MVWYFFGVYTGLLIFRTVTEPRNSGKSAKSCEIHKNTKKKLKFGRNLIKYMSVQHIWNLFQLQGLFTCTCCKLANLSWNFVTEMCKQRPKTTRHRLCCKKLGTSHNVKGFAIGSFLEHIVGLRKTDWFLAKFALKITTIADSFLVKFAPKIPAKSADFSANLSLKIPRNLTFSSATYQKPCLCNK